MKFKTTLTFTTVLTAMVAVASSTTGYADGKVFPGSVCKPSVSQGEGGLFYSSRSVYYTASERTTKVRVFLSCPLTRDNVSKPWKALSIWVHDNSEIAHVRCTAFVYPHELFGSAYRDVKLSGATPSFRGTTALIFVPPSRPFIGGSFSVQCLLPGNTEGSAADFSSIYTITLIEEFTTL